MILKNKNGNHVKKILFPKINEIISRNIYFACGKKILFQKHYFKNIKYIYNKPNNLKEHIYYAYSTIHLNDICILYNIKGNFI